MSTSALPKRFYKSVGIAPRDGGWAIELDARPIKTPARAELMVPAEKLASSIAAEWDAQSEALDLMSMTLTRLANVAIDRAPETRAEMAEELVRYAGTDLTCHLADGPTGLRERQQAAWGPLRSWAGKTLDVVLVPVEGIIASPQPEASIEAVRRHALGLDDFRLTGLTWACGMFGSVVLALACEQGHISLRHGLSCACIDEDWQAEHWGEDEEAKAARESRERDADALQAWFDGMSA